MWTRIQNVTQICLGLTHTPKYVESGIPFYSVKDISSGELDTTNPKYISAAEFEKFPDGAKPQYGDILFGRVGTLGKPTIVNTNSPFGIFVSLGFFRKYSHEITSEFFVHWMNSSLFWGQVNMNVKGAVLTNLNTGWLSKFLIPIPPSKEQARIVAQCEIAIRYIEEIENAGIEVYNLISTAKSKILDLAIRGKLVPQDPNDEPASILVEHIREEKEELIKQGKIKRDKKESVIFKGEDNSYYEKIGDEITCIDDELPFEIPNTWEWLRLENCCSKEIRRGKSPKYTDASGTLVFAQKCNTKYAGIDIGLALYLDENTLSKYPADEYMQDGDVVINSTGTGTLGRVGLYQIADNRSCLPIVPDSHVTVIRSFKNIQSFYLYTFLKANQNKLEKKGEGSTNQKELKPVTLKELLVPMPPLTEQKQISATIMRIFSIINTIEKSLS